MTAPRDRPAGAVTRPWTDMALHHGTPRTGWCPTCKAWTFITAELLLLAPEGVANVGAWSWCEVCQDPEHPLPTRRTDRRD